MRRTYQLLVVVMVLLGGFVALRIRANRVDPVTTYLALVWLAGFMLLSAEGVAHRLGTSPSRRANIRLLLLATCASVLCVEFGLRLFVPRLETYPERNNLPYRSQYQADQRLLHVYGPGQQIREQKPEFVHVRTANRLGLADREMPPTKAPGEYRILALGDSFTEGVGASADATWVRVMERELQARYPRRGITTLNAGVSGSDPFDEYAVLSQRLLPLRPDLVILAMNSSDIAEVLVRGGRERFRPDGTVRFRMGPWWEPVYAVSYLSRLIVHSVLDYDLYLIPNRRMPAELETAAGKIRGAVEDIQQLCDDQHVALLVVVHPARFEVVRGSYDTRHGAAYSALVTDLAGDPRVRLANLLKDFLAEGSMTPQNAAQFYWAQDLHHNERGYDVMGRAIARHVVQMGVIEGPKGAAR